MLAMHSQQSTLSFSHFEGSAHHQQQSASEQDVDANTLSTTREIPSHQISIDRASRESTPLSVTTSVILQTPLKSETHASDMANSKKRKLTDVEREVLEIEKKHKQLEKEAEKARKEEEKRSREEAKRLKEEEKDEKKRLKEQEKAVKEAEKVAKDAEKEEKRKQKEAERLLKEEEKRVKEEAKEVERRAKEEESRAKEEEKLKKEKAQLRLNSFFTKPKPPLQAKTVIKVESSTISTTACSAATETIEQVKAKRMAEFEKMFPPFFLHAHTTLATRPASIDTRFESPELWLSTPVTLSASLHDALSPHKRRCRRVLENVKLIIEGLNKPDQSQSADSQQAFQSHYEHMLKEIPLKSLKFAEDVRPAYVGTITKETQAQDRRRLRRNPCTRALPILNYDYDSEAEWEEPEEGEEIGSEDEEEASDGEDDMDEFLDDAGTENPARRQALGDIEVVTTGLMWESRPRKLDLIPFGEKTINVQDFRMQSLLPVSTTSIDPFSLEYWPSDTKHSSHKPSDMAAPTSRTPLSTLKSAENLPINAFLVSPNVKQDQATENKPTGEVDVRPTVLTARAKPIPPALLEPFKACILENAEHTKLGLIEILKKSFPSLTKSTVQETLLTVAKREGSKNNEKRWMLCA